MMRMNFNYIRKYKNKLAKRNRQVVYDSQSMRIASTNGDGLVLKSRVLVHANDVGLVYEMTEKREIAIKLLSDSLEEFINDGDVWDLFSDESDDEYVAEVCEIARQIVKDVRRAYKTLESGE